MFSEVDELADKALRALREGDPREAWSLLSQAVQKAESPRADLTHAMGVVLLQLGEAAQARRLMEEAVELCWKQGAPPELLVQAYLGLAGACEDLGDASAALAAYDQALEADDASSAARSGKANVLFGLGQIDAGLQEMDRFIAEGSDEDEMTLGAKALVEAVRRFVAERHPHDFIEAHREGYVEFFDEIAQQQAEQGWMAECARMKRAPDGSLVNAIPEGARPYAAVRVDLVDPKSGQAGQIGDQPMVVAVGDFEALAHAVVTLDADTQHPFKLRYSSQAPWDQLPIQVLFEREGGDELLDEVMGDWYRGGFDGRFGSRDAGRLHYISDPTVLRDGRAVIYDVDMGRASLLAIEDLLSRLVQLHRRFPLREVLIGRGYLSV